MAEIDYEVGTEQMESFTPVPKDKYEAAMTNSEGKDTADGHGKILSITWTITSGEYQGRRIFDNVNLVNKNQQAVDIGRKQLNSISAACGYPVGTRISDSSMLHDRPCLIDVSIQPAGNDKKGVFREARNVIKGYSPLEGSSPQQSAAPAPAGRPAAQAAKPVAAGGKPPWARK